MLDAEPDPVRFVDDDELEAVARTFGDLVDLKSPWLHGHSAGVADLAAAAVARLGLADDVRTVRVAGHLHDLGRVGVSSRIWDKPGPLSQTERDQARLHAYHSERILTRVPALAEVARLAGQHHERCDGSGYHRGRHRAPSSRMPSRVLAAADAFRTLVEGRPHRPALPPAQAADRLRAEVAGRRPRRGRRGGGAAGRRPAQRGPRARPAGLTERQVEVLRLVARGLSNREIADRLVISRRTAEHHVQDVYLKIGVSTRAAAAAVRDGARPGRQTWVGLPMPASRPAPTLRGMAHRPTVRPLRTAPATASSPPRSSGWPSPTLPTSPPPGSRSTPCRCTSPDRSARTRRAPGLPSEPSPSPRWSCDRSPGGSPTSGDAGRCWSGARCCARSPWCSPRPRDTLPPVVALRLVLGVAEAAFFVASFAALADLAPPSRIGEALSYNSLGLYLGLALGPPLGELLVTHRRLHRRLVRRRRARAARRGGRARDRRDPGAATGADGPARLIHRKAIAPASASSPRSSRWAASSPSPRCTPARSGWRRRALPLFVYGIVVVICRIAFAKVPDRLPALPLGAAALAAIAAGLTVMALWSTPAGMLAGTAVVGARRHVQHPGVLLGDLRDRRARPSGVRPPAPPAPSSTSDSVAARSCWASSPRPPASPGPSAWRPRSLSPEASGRCPCVARRRGALPCPGAS